MANINKVVFCGPLVRDVTTRVVGSSTVANFTLVSKRDYKKPDGSTGQETCYIDIEAWGSTAQNAAAYLRKDSEVTVEGRLKFQSWTDKVTQQLKSKHVIYCENLIFNEMTHKTPIEMDTSVRDTSVHDTSTKQTLNTSRPEGPRPQAPRPSGPRPEGPRLESPKFTHESFEDLPF